MFSLDSKLSIWDTDKEFNFEDGVDIVTMNTFGAFGTATIELCEVKKYDGWIKEIKEDVDKELINEFSTKITNAINLDVFKALNKKINY